LLCLKYEQLAFILILVLSFSTSYAQDEELKKSSISYFKFSKIKTTKRIKRSQRKIL